MNEEFPVVEKVMLPKRGRFLFDINEDRAFAVYPDGDAQTFPLYLYKRPECGRFCPPSWWAFSALSSVRADGPFAEEWGRYVPVHPVSDTGFSAEGIAVVVGKILCRYDTGEYSLSNVGVIKRIKHRIAVCSYDIQLALPPHCLLPERVFDIQRAFKSKGLPIPSIVDRIYVCGVAHSFDACVLYWRGEGVAQDVGKAVELATEAVRAGVQDVEGLVPGLSEENHETAVKETGDSLKGDWFTIADLVRWLVIGTIVLIVLEMFKIAN